MSKVRMDEEGVQALKALATALPEASKAASDAASNLESSFEEKKELLGPHTSQIQEIVNLINEAQNEGQSSVAKVQKNLIVTAAKLAAIISKSLGGSLGK